MRPSWSGPGPVVSWGLALAQGAGLAAFGGFVAGTSRRRGAALTGAAITGAASIPYIRTVARHQPYSITPLGLTRWFVDASWSAPNTFAGALFLAHQRARGNELRPSRTTGSGTVDLSQAAITGYATTVGTVVAGSRPRLDAHERVHVTQERLLGPLYGPLVAIDYLRLICFPTWWRRHDHDAAPIVDLRTYLQRGVYRRVWHERWAYAVAPSGAAPLTLRETVTPVVDHVARVARTWRGTTSGGDEEWAQQDSNL